MRQGSRHLGAIALGLLLGCADDEVNDVPPPATHACADAEALDLEALYAQFESEIHPRLTRAQDAGGCASCHNPGTTLPVVIWPDPRLTMEALWADGYLAVDGDGTLLSALSREDGKRMPLGGAAWSEEDVGAVESFVCNLHASGFEAPDLCEGDPDPGNTLIRRLTNYEYDRSVSDLTGDATAPGTGFASDQPTHGFDNVSSGQQLSLGHLEQYHDAASLIAGQTLLVPAPIALGFEAEDLSAFLYTGGPVTNGGHGGPVAGEHYHFQRIRSYVTTGLLYFPYDGTYSISVRARGKHDVYRTDVDLDGTFTVVDDDVAPQLRIEVDGIEVDVFDVVGIPYDHETFGPWQIFERQHLLSQGTHTVRVWIENVTFGAAHQRDVELDVDLIDVDGPMLADLPETDEARIARFLICSDGSDAGCVDAVIDNALTTLWRRPATSGEVDRYRVLIDDATANGDSFKDGVEAVLEAALLSPHFLFRPEIDPDPAVAETRPLEPYELATRLAYLVWSSAPDAQLLMAAADGTLVGDEALSAELDRMLDDPRASALIESFAAQWVHLGPMEYMQPSSELFPEFDDPLRQAMRAEIVLLFQEFLDEDKNILDIVDTDFTYLNDRLASHYGIDLPGATAAFERVSVSDRGGLLESAGFLTLSSHPARTSPTKRGKWILEQLLCQPPGDPPPNTDTTVDVGSADSLREFLSAHREDPACAGCHASMDPLGITLEHFDPVGRWRDIDDWGDAVDPRGELATGDVLQDHRAMLAYVKNHPGFEACVTKKMLIYSLGRDPQLFDSCAVDAIQSEFAASGHTLRGLIRAVVMSPMFRQRRPEKPGEYDYLNATEEN